MRAYEGNKPYLFISYSHKDTKMVFSVIRHLQEHGFRVWFDNGIEAGSEWPEYIASHLMGCSCVLTFISKNFVHSPNCRRELTFAQNENKPMLNIYIDDVVLSDGMRMQLGLNQALWHNKFSSDAEFYDAVTRAQLMQDCKEKPPVSVKAEPQRVATPKPAAAPKPATTPAPKPTIQNNPPADPKPNTDPVITEQYAAKNKQITRISVYIEICYVILCAILMTNFTFPGSGFWLPVLTIGGAHLALMVVNWIIYRTIAKSLPKDQQEDAGTNMIMAMVGFSILAVIVGAFFVQYDLNGFMKFLVSLGLNAIPTVLGFVIGSIVVY